MRVVHVCRMGWPHVGGLETAVAGLAAALVDRGHDVEVVTLDRGFADDRALPDATWRGVRYRRLPRVGPRRWPFARGLVAAVRGADVVHVHGIDGLADQLLARRAAVGAPIGVSTHGGFLHTDRHRALKAVWLRTATRYTLARADAVWFTSEADRRVFAAAGVRGEVMPNGVDVARFAAIRRRPEPGRWVVVGRVDVHKGLDDLIDTLAVLARRDPRPFTVEVIGPEARPGLIRALRERARARGVADRVSCSGAVTDAQVDAALAGAELALFPSRYEGFGLAVVEAMAAGVPVVVNGIAAFDALVCPGVDGWRARFADAEAAAAVIIAARDGDHAAIAAAARASARAHGWEARAPAWERAYAALVSR